MMRSMSDEQMLAKYGYDKQPYGDPKDSSQRSFQPLAGWILAPRPESIPSRDPLPWHNVDRSYPWDRTVTRWEESFWSPRPRFARPPVNPILSALRDDLYNDDQYGPDDYLKGINEPDSSLVWGLNATPEQVEFARNVLTRIAAVIQ